MSTPGQRARRRLAVVRSVARTWPRRPSAPTRLVVDVTRRCNLRCRMCRTWERAASEEMSAAQYAALFAELDELFWLDVTGGEPFLRKDIEDVLTAAVEHAPRLSMLHYQTNGWFTQRVVEVTRRIRGLDPRFDLVITVSVDGPRDVHDSVRGIPGSFDRAMNTARALMELPDVEVHIGTTVQRANARQLNSLARTMAAELPGFSPRRWHLNELSRSQHFFANAALDGLEAPADERLTEQLRRRGVPRSMVELMESLFLLHLRRYRRTGVRAVPCEALRSTAFVAPEGDLYPCHIYDRPLGNVTERPLRELWASAATRRARADVQALACGGCFSACEAYPALAGAPVRAVARAALELANVARGSAAR